MKRLTVWALVGMVVLHLVATLLVEGAYPVFALVIELPLLVLAGLVATGRRGAAAAAAVVAGLLAAVTAASQLSDPTVSDAPEFIPILLFVGLGAVVLVAGSIMAVKGGTGVGDRSWSPRLRDRAP